MYYPEYLPRIPEKIRAAAALVASHQLRAPIAAVYPAFTEGRLFMTDPIIGYNFFADSVRRPIYSHGDRQYVHDPDGERVYGLWIILEEDRCNL